MTGIAPKVAGVVVLYECDANIVANLATYADDLDALVIVDNSAAWTPAAEAAAAAHRHGTYVFNGANLGVAAALNIGVARARAAGASFLLTMDQDSSFDAVPFRTFRDLVLALPFLDELAVAAPVFEGAPAAPDGPVAVDSDTVITSGSIVNLANQARVGPFDERLFIDEVDHDFCLRARDAGLRVVAVPSVRLCHRLGQPGTVSLLGHTLRWSVHGPVRHYYMVRNGLYMLGKHRRRHRAYGLRRIARAGRTVAAALLLAPGRRARFRLVLRAVADYRAGRMGPLGAAPGFPAAP
jgi:rhamnosyltransferase